jgi:hypothetical protein
VKRLCAFQIESKYGIRDLKASGMTAPVMGVWMARYPIGALTSSRAARNLTSHAGGSPASASKNAISRNRGLTPGACFPPYSTLTSWPSACSEKLRFRAYVATPVPCSSPRL